MMRLCDGDTLSASEDAMALWKALTAFAAATCLASAVSHSVTAAEFTAWPVAYNPADVPVKITAA
jgi:hypothetical protein